MLQAGWIRVSARPGRSRSTCRCSSGTGSREITKDTYADTLRLHVVPFLGSCRVAETDRTVARNYITALLEERHSANTIRQAKVVLCAMFGMAVADGYVDYNPFHDVKIPKVPGGRAIRARCR